MTSYLLVHGAWHGAWCWEAVQEHLLEAVPRQLDDRPHRLRGEGRIDDHGERRVAPHQLDDLPSPHRPVRGRVEDGDVHRMPGDDLREPRPVVHRRERVGVAEDSAEVGEKRRGEVGDDVH